MDITLIHGECRRRLSRMPDNSVDSIVTDPPYGLSFMGKKWDYDVPSIKIWRECLRVLKPGGFLLAFAGTRTQHRMCCNIEDAGFEIRDMIAWIYGSGFPKSLNIGKAVDKLQGTPREYLGKSKNKSGIGNGNKGHTTVGGTIALYTDVTKGNSPYEGWGTSLKPALEPITVARKPLSEKTVASNVVKYGTGGINIDGCRVETLDDIRGISSSSIWSVDGTAKQVESNGAKLGGRFPANLIHDGSEEVVSLFPDSKSGKSKVNKPLKRQDNKIYGKGLGTITKDNPHNDSGSVARFFKECKSDNECSLCCLPLVKNNKIKGDTSCLTPVKNVGRSSNPNTTTQNNDSALGNVVAKTQHGNEGSILNTNKSAHNVEKPSQTMLVTSASIVPKSVTPQVNNKSVQFVKCVGNLCNTCAINIVQSLVVISEAQKDLGSQEESPAIQDFIGNYRKCILLQNLVKCVEQMDSIDTTPITTNLLRLFGYVRHAINLFIQKIEKSELKRFVYQAKCSKKDRNEGLEEFEEKVSNDGRKKDINNGYQRTTLKRSNNHPTVKPTKLMQYLVRLVTPKGGTCLDPFMGSGSTGKACVLEGFNFIGIEMEQEYLEIAKARINAVTKN